MYGFYPNLVTSVATSGIADYRRRDRVLAGEAASTLIAQLVGWLVVSFVGYALLFWPFLSGGITAEFTLAGSSLFTLRLAVPRAVPPRRSSTWPPPPA